MASNAASRVFAIPELLEHILLYYAHNDAAITRDDCIERPSCGLFVIQRTTRDFQATIQGSKSLRRLMFLQPVDFSALSEHDADNYHHPLWWLLEEMAFEANYWSPNEVETNESFLELHNLSVDDFKFLAEEYFGPTPKRTISAWLRSEASWRRIKVCNSTVPTATTIEMTYYTTTPEVLDHVCYTWQVDIEDTLGSIFDEFVVVIQAVATEEGKYQRDRDKAERRNRKRELSAKEIFDLEYEDELHDGVLDEIIHEHLAGEAI